MEKVIPLFQYEPLVLTPKPKTSNEEEERRQINGVGPSKTRTVEEELADLRGGRDSSQKKVGGMKNVLEQTLELIEFVPHEVSSQEYGSAATKIRDQI